jgi:crotonobetainyl-CoA:carnitine CoA-transferase CaiB-like acyl-CoA transferase
MVRARFAELDSSKLIPNLERESVPFSRVNNYEEALSDIQVAHRGLVHAVDHPDSGRIRVVGPPWIMTDNRVKVFAPPLLGQHTAEILRTWLAWSPARTKKFKAELAASPAA